MSDPGNEMGETGKRLSRKASLVPPNKVRSFESGAEILSQLRDHCKPTVKKCPSSYWSVK